MTNEPQYAKVKKKVLVKSENARVAWFESFRVIANLKIPHIFLLHNVSQVNDSHLDEPK